MSISIGDVVSDKINLQIIGFQFLVEVLGNGIQKKEQFYLHNFLESQPDLNFHNVAVQNQMLNEIQFWLDFGIDGFRFDVINFLFHDKGLRNNPYKDASEVRPLGFNKDNPYGLQHHKFDNTQIDTLIYLEKIRKLLDKYNAISIVFLGEICLWNLSFNNRRLYK